MPATKLGLKRILRLALLPDDQHPFSTLPLLEDHRYNALNPPTGLPAKPEPILQQRERHRGQPLPNIHLHPVPTRTMDNPQTPARRLTTLQPSPLTLTLLTQPVHNKSQDFHLNRAPRRLPSTIRNQDPHNDEHLPVQYRDLPHRHFHRRKVPLNPDRPD